MLTQGSPNKDAAVQFLEQHLLKASGLTAMNKDKPLGVPASKSMFWTLYSDARIRTSMDAIYGGRPMPSNSEMTLFWTHLGTALADVVSKERTPREARPTASAAYRRPSRLLPRRASKTAAGKSPDDRAGPSAGPYAAKPAAKCAGKPAPGPAAESPPRCSLKGPRGLPTGPRRASGART